MSYTSTTATKVDLYQIVTDRIVTALESGVQPWRKPWNASAPAIAMGRPLRENGVGYTAINTVNLWVSAARRGLTNPYWLTWNRITELGGSVRKGAKSEMAFYVGSKLVRDGDPITEGETVMEGDDGVRRISFLKYYRVFNASEVDDLPARYQVETEAPAPIDHANPEAAAFIDATGATIAYGRPRACYIPSQDVIHMPAYQSFDPKAQFYATAFHELVHWTKHESRLNRSVGQVKRWGDEAYAMEELVAELGAAFLCADHNLCNVTEDQSAAYLAAWLKVLKGDNRAIFKAATWAEKAAGYLTDAASKPAPAPVAPALPAPQSEAPA
jgi:antirestriction protein ArdC